MTVKAGGVVFISTKTHRVGLYLRSPRVNSPLTWAFAGGKIHANETILRGISRELREEIGFVPEYKKVIPIDYFKSNDENFIFYSFAVIVEDEFIPRINHESGGWGWFDIDSLPKPLHQGAKLTLMHRDFKKIFKDMIADNS